MKKTIIAIQFLLICTSLSAQPGPTPTPEIAPSAGLRFEPDQPKSVYIPGGFGKGQDYLKMSEKEKRAYAMGAMNGMLVAPFFDAPEKSTKWLGDYLKDVSDEQVAAIILMPLASISQLVPDAPGSNCLPSTRPSPK